jgi:polysaccharide deacetylase family protein (PEP-CTERM system associated)
MNVFSVDLEDWYHGIELPFEDWSSYEDRLRKGVDVLLELLDKHNTKATFFTLGWVGEKYPKLVKEISDLGHEIASHGYSHEKVYDLSPKLFREEISKTKKILENITSNEVTSYRAPFFSVTNKSLWALDILKEEGYSIDCSISSVKTWRYGITNAPNEIFIIKENGLTEFPVSTFQFLIKKFAIGGAYLRLFPYMLTYKGLSQRAKEGKVSMFYVHPWEYDIGHPVVNMEKKAKFTHYTRLNQTLPFTDKLLSQFEFNTLSNVIKKHKRMSKIKEYSIEILKD